ncbi:uncharacterized protein TRIADDRAFT_56556 [Trichoplax adhaerens]|uniref:G-protein coupled receptors family 1 profile domain-containing protein n=1 Tax=Trichoplax adhaerens TaxID=10228 RepID=B3RYH1_TRIAD|nr:hypothetical protein TRIADDRAFT_56556 [Trichoplax adhaerens]EDV24596.1 hypothetical protein TRIADDRAFT_56556 [Trichoplax adhaerens]|eukprot:XP_002112486.1 hypothetical protein TRIADDRAFT_56556 [Trichoplax adhaerens]
MNDSIINKTFDLGIALYYYTSLALIPVFAFAFIINIFLLYVLLQGSAFQCIPYKLIRISVISDALSSLTAAIGYSLITQNFPYQSGKLLCQFIMYLVFTFNGISMNNLFLIAIDRYYAIVKPFSGYHQRHRRRAFFIGQIISWSLSIAFNIILAPYIGVTHADTTLCDIPDIKDHLFIPITIILFCILQYVIPCTTITVIYWRIVHHQKHYVRPGENSFSQRDHEAKKKKFNKILMTITLCYILTTWPYYAGVFGMAITRQSVITIRNKDPIIFIFLFCSLGTSICITVINPFIYLQFDANIRAKFVEILLRRKKERKALSVSSKTKPIELSQATRKKHKIALTKQREIKLPRRKVTIAKLDRNKLMVPPRSSHIGRSLEPNNFKLIPHSSTIKQAAIQKPNEVLTIPGLIPDVEIIY